MTRLLKWRWVWELDEDNWSWRQLITGDSCSFTWGRFTTFAATWSGSSIPWPWREGVWMTVWGQSRGQTSQGLSLWSSPLPLPQHGRQLFTIRPWAPGEKTESLFPIFFPFLGHSMGLAQLMKCIITERGQGPRQSISHTNNWLPNQKACSWDAGSRKRERRTLAQTVPATQSCFCKLANLLLQCFIS